MEFFNSAVGVLQTLVVAPVSYTHLDVYKRQYLKVSWFLLWH